jgi:hypothetical protein
MFLNNSAEFKFKKVLSSPKVQREKFGYAIHENLPRPHSIKLGMGDNFELEHIYTFFEAPTEPHVFEANSTFKFPEGEFCLGNLRALCFHGGNDTEKNGSKKWTAGCKNLSGKNVSVSDIIKRYESSTGKKIDMLIVCNEEPLDRDNYVTWGTEFNDKIFCKNGIVKGSISYYNDGKLQIKIGAPNNLDDWSKRLKTEINMRSATFDLVPKNPLKNTLSRLQGAIKKIIN